MSTQDTSKSRWTGYGIVAIAGLVCLSAIFFLASSVAQDLRLLNSAQSDNVQWTLSQTEVEFLELEALLNANDSTDLKAVRQEFDIFYSRIKTLRSGSIYATLRDAQEFDDALSAVQDFLDASIPLIDGTDDALRVALPGLSDDALEVRVAVRTLSRSGLSQFASAGDERRAHIAATLFRLAMVVAALVLILIALAFYLWRSNILNVKRERESAMTGARMNTIMSTSLDGVIVTDNDGRILEFNNAAENMFGHVRLDVIGRNIASVIVPDHFVDAHNAGMERMRAHGEKRVVGKGRVQLEAKRHTGDIFPVELAIQTAETDDGELFIAFLRDISVRVKTQEDLIEARDKALAGERAKSDFLAVMSHEIRTPLNGLIGNLDLLRGTEIGASQANLIGNMEASGRLLMRHVSDVLDISKYDAGKLVLNPKPMELNQFLQEMVDSQTARAAEQNTSLEWEWIGPHVDWVNADRNVLQAVLLNLVGNAVKFTRYGAVAIEAEVVGGTDEFPVIEFKVADTGIGIKESAQAKIFDDYQTGNVNYDRIAGGTGLGLGIAKRFTNAMGGEIEAESTYGEGSLFSVRIPMERCDPVEISAPTIKAVVDVAPLNVLVVEDNEINRQVVREMLKAQGHTVTEANDGLSGVQLSEATRFDLILMDISMPIMDGRAATRAIRTNNGASKDAPIIALTANVMVQEQELFLQDGMNDVLSKPLSRASLRTALQGLDTISTNHIVSDQKTANIFNFEHFRETRDVLDKAMFDANLKKFISDADNYVEWISAPEAPEAALLAARSHQMAGSAAIFGAQGLLEALKDLETEAKREDFNAAKIKIGEISTLWAQTKGLILE